MLVTESTSNHVFDIPNPSPHRHFSLLCPRALCHSLESTLGLSLNEFSKPQYKKTSTQLKNMYMHLLFSAHAAPRARDLRNSKKHLKETWTMQTINLSSSSDSYFGWVSIGCICLPLSQSFFLPPPVSLSFILSLLNLPFSLLHVTSLWQRARHWPIDTGWSLHANFLLVMSLPDSLRCVLWHEAGVGSDETAMFSLFVQSLAYCTRSEVNHHQICNPSSDEAHALRWWIWSRKCSSRKTNYSSMLVAVQVAT